MAITYTPDPIHAGDIVTVTTDMEGVDIFWAEAEGVILDKSVSSGVISFTAPAAGVAIRIVAWGPDKKEIVRVRVQS